MTGMNNPPGIKVFINSEKNMTDRSRPEIEGKKVNHPVRILWTN